MEAIFSPHTILFFSEYPKQQLNSPKMVHNAAHSWHTGYCDCSSHCRSCNFHTLNAIFPVV